MSQVKTTFSGVEDAKKLAKRLGSLDKIKEYGRRAGREEEWVVVHAFSDLEESFLKVLTDLFPRLRDTETEEDLQDLLLDIGEEFRHILYHIKDPMFYRYLFDED